MVSLSPHKNVSGLPEAGRAQAARFTWDATARATREVYLSAANGGHA